MPAIRWSPTRSVFHQTDETIRGHVFCSFLALVLRKELDNRLEKAGHSFEWPHIKQDLEALQEIGRGRMTSARIVHAQSFHLLVHEKVLTFPSAHVSDDRFRKRHDLRPQVFAQGLGLAVQPERGGNPVAQDAPDIKIQGQQVGELIPLHLIAS